MQGIVIFFNGARGAAVLRALISAGHGLNRVVVPRGKVDAAVAELCREARIRLQEVEKVNDSAFVTELAATKPELSIIAGYSSIFHAALINTPRKGTINLHSGRLPQYRGGSPLNWQMINGETEAGISVIRVDTGIDTGPVLAAATIAIAPDDTIAELHAKANKLFPQLVTDVVDGLEQGDLAEVEQDNGEAVYWHQRRDEDGLIDWRNTEAKQVYDLVRSVTHPYPGAFTYWGERRVRIFACTVPDAIIKGTAGRVCQLQGEGPFIVCADRAILASEVVIECDGPRTLAHGAILG
jgi:methionyl-tRNA formyltransferase